MKKNLLLLALSLIALTAFSQRKEGISIERYYHIQKASVWFHSIGLNFQPVTMGDVKTETLYIYNSGSDAVSFTLSDMPDGYSVEFEPELLLPEQEGKVLITLNTEENGVYGPAINYFFIESSIAAERPYRVLVSPNIREDFSDISEGMRAISPIIEFPETVSDFGSIAQESVYTCEFPFRNAGKSDLYIRNVKAGCGCTITHTSQDTLLPGESATLSVEFRSGHKKGEQDSKITVVSNDPEQPQILLHITGEVYIPETKN